MTERRKPKLLIIGHARHGKDTVAQMIQDNWGLAFISSSLFVGEEIIWPLWGKERYPTFDAMFEDRVNYRSTWFDLIAAYNTPDQTKTATTMVARGYDLYVGMRRRAELQACARAGIFDKIIWVEASKRHEPEQLNSMELNRHMADRVIDNNGTLKDLEKQLANLQESLHYQGFDVGYVEPKMVQSVTGPLGASSESPVSLTMAAGASITEAEAWMMIPDGATPLLDHGFYQVKDVMGNDHDIAESARMSYGRGTKKQSTDEQLIRYLLLNHHTSPFEMGEVKVHMRMPIFVMRQLVRHRTANLNEYSGRYSEMPKLYYIPTLDQIKMQHAINKQGSGLPLPEETAKGIQASMICVSEYAFHEYNLYLAAEVSRETARIILPLNIYTEVVWKIDVNNLMKLLMLRDDNHAQWEIRVYAAELAKTLKQYFPLTYATYELVKNMVHLTIPQLLAVVTNNSANGLNLGKGEQVKVDKILDMLLGMLQKP